MCFSILSRVLPVPASNVVRLDYGVADPLLLEVQEGARLTAAVAPDGAVEAEARRLTAEAVCAPQHGPPLAAHVVPGDRVVIAVAGDVPQAGHVVAAVADALATAGVAESDVTVLQAPPLEAGVGAAPPPLAGATVFDATVESATSYLAADEAGRPLYLARALVDADVVVAVGEWSWNAALGGRSLEGELWPTFSRQACRRDLVRSLARRGRGALGDWKSGVQEIAWQLGVCASLRLVRGRGGSLFAARFGLPDEAGRRAREAAAAWQPVLGEPADVAIASLSAPGAGFGAVTRAVAAAARVTRPSGTICVATRMAAGPGIIFLRWRQGAPLKPLVHEAIASGDPVLIADALETRLFARALEDRRLVLLSDIPEADVEELEFGHAATPETVERLAHRAESVVVLPEADLMLPRR